MVKPSTSPAIVHQSRLGRIIHADSRLEMGNMPDGSVDLVMTSPPFSLLRTKDYGNVDSEGYSKWFRPFAAEIHRILKDSGSFVIDIGSAWNRGRPTRSLYQFKLLIMLCDELGFHLAQDFYWWNPAKIPSPAEWVTIRRVRVKDAVNTVWWLSKTPWPKASNRRVLQPYSERMRKLLANGAPTSTERPSGHDIDGKFKTDNQGAIPPNLLAIANTDSNSRYLRHCRETGQTPHPARFPRALPEYFIRLVTDRSDHVLDPFAGSCVTGEAAELTGRRWTCIEIKNDYCKSALARFEDTEAGTSPPKLNDREYWIAHPNALRKPGEETMLPTDGGRNNPRAGARRARG